MPLPRAKPPSTASHQLEKLPFPDLIFRSVELETRSLPESSRDARLRAAFAGAYAAVKIPLYQRELHEVNDLRRELGRAIRALIEPTRFAPSDEDEYTSLVAYNSVMASHLMGRQEIAYHRFSTCVAQIDRLLPLVLRICGIKLPADDLDFPGRFRTLRDQFEHLDERLPTLG